MTNTERDHTLLGFIFKIINPITVTLIVACGLIAAVWSFLGHAIPDPKTLCILLTTGIVMSNAFTLLAILTHDPETHLFHIFSVLVICIGLINASLGDYKTEVVKYKPNYIFRTDSKVLITFGGIEYSSTEIKTYNMKDSDIRICKRMAWDAWGDRNYDAIFVCDGEWRKVPQNINN